MRLVLSNEVAADPENLSDYIATDNTRQAVAFVHELRGHCASPLDIPKRFPLTPRHEACGICRMTHGNSLICSRVVAENVKIVRNLHGVRDNEPLLFPAK